MPDGIAVDWITKNVYFTESSANRIDMFYEDILGNHTYRASVISQGLRSPRGITLDPRVGYMFITDWGRSPKVLRARMDGSNVTLIVRDKLGWPNSITIDYKQNIVYWIDARFDYIDAVDYNGGNRRTLIKGKQWVPHPFAITMLYDYIYFTDWIKKGIVRVHKNNGSDYFLIHKNLSRPMDMHAYHISRQPEAPNPCAIKKGGCQHICVIKHTNKSSCLCDVSYVLNPDGKTCKKVEKFLIYAGSWEVRGISLDKNYPHDVMMPVLGLKSAVATDFDVKNQQIYFSDLKKDQVGRMDMTKGGSIEWIIKENVENVDGLAVDWISRNLYWTDSRETTSSRISVAKLDGENRFQKTLKSENIGKPRAIVVHPVKG